MTSQATRSAPFLLEVGTEEIPARMAQRGADTLREALAQLVANRGVEGVEWHSAVTPRRLAVWTHSLPLRQPDRSETVLGPPARVAYRDGEPTPAAHGFARKLGVDVADLVVEDTPRGPYVAVHRHVPGRPLSEILGEALPGILGKLPWPKSMRWGSGRTPFVRPIHWMCCVLDGEVVDFEFAGVRSGNLSRGHRFAAPEPFTASAPGEWFEALRARYVEPLPEIRRARIEERARELAAEIGGTPQLDAALVDEITHLVEWPLPARGEFAASHLELPPEVLVAAMCDHQRYIPVRNEANGALLPAFVVVANTPVRDMAVVVRGNERVLAARLSDARFFWETDRKHRLEHFVDSLRGRVWLEGLGTMRDKVERLQRIAAAIAERVAPEAREAAARAAFLSKADLDTEMVGEFPELQGIMGSWYAQADGEPEDVARAIREHYLPRGPADELPASTTGAIVALADRADNLAGCFGLGLTVSGAQDPYGLRRATLGVLRILLDRAWPLPVHDLVEIAIEAYGDTLPRQADEVAETVLDFFRGRARSYFGARYPVDLVDAVLASGSTDVRSIAGRLEALAARRDSADFEPLILGFKRVSNILRKQGQGAQSADATGPWDEPAEAALFEAMVAAEPAVDAALREGRWQDAVDALLALKAPIDRFFDDVLVMAPDPAVRRRRLGLLARLREVFLRVADLSRVQS